MNIKSRVDKLDQHFSRLTRSQLSEDEIEGLETHRSIMAMTSQERSKRIDELVAKRTNLA